MRGYKTSITPELAKELVRKRTEDGLSFNECAQWLKNVLGEGVGKTTVLRWFHGGGGNPLGIGGDDDFNLDEAVEADKQQVREQAAHKQLQQKYDALTKQAVGWENLLNAMKDSVSAFPPVKVHYKHVDFSADSPQAAVAPLACLHIGEYVDPRQMNYINAYDMDIFNRRMYGWSDLVLELVELERRKAEIPVLYVPALGDFHGGIIHLELLKSNVANEMDIAVRGAYIWAQALMKIAQHFEKVVVPCVFGNHGRMTQKPPAKDAYVNWDTIIYQLAALFCQKQPNIEFQIPHSFLHVFRAAEKNILILHGNTIRGGFAGIPFYGMIRAFARLREMLQFRTGLEDTLLELASKKDAKLSDVVGTLATYFDSVIIGQFHTVNELDIGTGEAHVAGTMKGPDEYSQTLHVASKPKQILLYYHPKYGYVTKNIIYLNRFDGSTNMFDDHMSDVWASMVLPLKNRDGKAS